MHAVMRTRNRVVIFLLAWFCCASRTASANEFLSSPLSDQELAGNVAGASIVVTFHADTQNAPFIALGDDEFGNAFGIETIGQDGGVNSISQAATSLAVRATLTAGLHSLGNSAF